MSIRRQTLWSMLPLALVTLVNVFSVPMFYKYLGAEMYALWFYVLTFSGSFGFMDLGLGVAVGRYIGVALGAGDRQAVRSYWATGNLVAIPLLVSMALLFTGLGVFFGPHWFNVTPGKVHLLQGSFLAGGIGLFLSYYGQFWNILSQAHLDFKFLSIVRVGVSLLQVIPAILIARLSGNPLLLISWASLIGSFQLAVLIWHAKKRYSLGFEFNQARWERAQEMAGYTGKTFLSLVINSLFGSIDRILLGKLAPAAAFAHYNIALNIGARMAGLSVSIMGPVFNNTNRSIRAAGTSSAAEIYDESFGFIFPWYLLAALWATLWSKPALELWLGPELGSHVALVFPLLIAGFSLGSISNISSSQLGSLNRVGTGVLFNVAAGLLAAAGVFIGWHFGGTLGVALGFVVSRLALVAQDIFVVRLIGAGGWLCSTTWGQVLRQGLLAICFYLGAEAIGDRRAMHLTLAATHAILASLCILHPYLNRNVSSTGNAPKNSPTMINFK